MENSSAQWLTRFRSVHPQAAARDHDPKFGPVFVRGAGARLWDADGADYIDLTCGYSAANFGQCFQPLVDAASYQLRQLSHVTGEPHVGRIVLSERLLSAFELPPATSQVMLNVSGARAIETAWKAAVAFRPGKIVTIGPAFHGRSLATLALGQTLPLPPPQPFAQHVHCGHPDEYPYCAACPLKLQFPACDLKCVRQVLAAISQHSADISAVLVEPAIGARGIILPPAEFLQRLRRITQEHGILLIADEIQTGLGRFGHMSLAASQGWQPDLLVLGKSLGGGLVPISAVLGRRDVLESLQVGSESETFAASPLATSVACEVLHQLQTGPWIQQGAKAGQRLRQVAEGCLLNWQMTNVPNHGQTFEVREKGSAPAAAILGGFHDENSAPESLSGCPGERPLVEGQGACCVIEFGPASPATAWRFAEACVRQRLLPQLTGPALSRVALLPALTISAEELSTTCERLQLAFTDCMNFESKLA